MLHEGIDINARLFKPGEVTHENLATVYVSADAVTWNIVEFIGLDDRAYIKIQGINDNGFR